MSTIDARHGHVSPLVAALAVAGMLAAAGVAGVAWHDHHDEHAGAPAGHHLVLPDYPPPLSPSQVRIHRAEERVGEHPAWPTWNGRRIAFGRGGLTG